MFVLGLRERAVAHLILRPTVLHIKGVVGFLYWRELDFFLHESYAVSSCFSLTKHEGGKSMATDCRHSKKQILREAEFPRREPRVPRGEWR